MVLVTLRFFLSGSPPPPPAPSFFVFLFQRIPSLIVLSLVALLSRYALFFLSLLMPPPDGFVSLYLYPPPPPFFNVLFQVMKMQLPPVGSPMEEDEAALAQIPQVSSGAVRCGRVRHAI